jgi:PAS domain S-box-containing protein
MLLTRMASPEHGLVLSDAVRPGGRVLVVDDVEAQRYAVSQALRAEGFEVLECADGASAIATAGREPLDAVVLDVGLPDMDGFEVCRRLKRGRAMLLPILHLSSARTSSDARAHGLDAGADGYLTHPFDPNELRAAVAALVRLKRNEAERVAGAAVNSLLLDSLDALADHVALLGPTGDVVAVNRAWEQFAIANEYHAGGTGLGVNYVDVCAMAQGPEAESAHECAGGLRRVLEGEVAGFEMDYPCHAPLEERWYRLTVRRVAHHGPVAAIATHADHTREHLAARAEAEARAAAEADRRRLAATLEALPVGVWIADAAGELTHSNPSAARIWGGHAPLASNLPGYAVYRARWPETGARLSASDWALSRALASGEVIMDELVEIERFNGTRGFMLTSAAPIRDEAHGIIGAVVTGIDVSEQQSAGRERERRVVSLESEYSRLATVFENAPSFLAVLRGPDHVFERVNPAYQQLVGHRDPVGLPIREALPEVVEQGFVAILDSVRTTGTPKVFSQAPVDLARTAGGPRERRYLDMVYQRLVDADGEYAVVAHGVDVTDSVMATEALHRTEQRLRDQFAKLPVATFLWEAAGDDFVLLDFNEAASIAFGCGGTAIGLPSRAVFPGHESVLQDLRRALATGVVVRSVVEFELGEGPVPRQFELTVGAQPPERVLVHAVDVTDRTELEGQLRQAQKMDAVGRLAGGVAHDFNNLLTVIGAHSAFLLESLGADDPQREDAEAIHKAGVRAAGLTRQLLAFSRKQILKPTVLDLNAIVEEARKMLERLLGEDIAITARLARNLGRVVADASQLDQVIVNLAVNARDAMPDGGRLTITTRNETIEPGMAGPRRVIPAGGYALLQVADTGIGMDATIQARLFEPFFTTKAPGKGTGLGLATVYGVVKQSAGYILVESEPGEGTTFSVYLPLVAHDTAGEELRAAVGAAVRGVETVLLVEDEPAVREIASRMLKRQGYVVLLAASGAEALAISAAFTGTIHLVLTDAVMPGMGGVEVVRRLRERRPALKALFMSGYTDDEIVRRGIVSSSMPFVQKPFAPADFARAVRDALDS